MASLALDEERAGPLYEPLTHTAPLTRRLAEHHCRPDGAGSTCAWYHGFWPFLRIFGMAASPDRHQDFFLDTLSSLAAGGGDRVLVSGTADYSMLAHVMHAWRAVGRVPEATVVDRCPTPGLLCTWYGQLTGIDVAALAADIIDVDFAPDERFDVICTHSFLSQFAPDRRPALLASWRRLLRPGGTVVTTTRISPPGAGDRLTFSPAQVDAFERQAGVEAKRWCGVLEEDPATLTLAARRYAERLVVHPTFSTAEVAALFQDNGFVLERLDEHHVGGSLERNSGPATNQPATHLRIVARRG